MSLKLTLPLIIGILFCVFSSTFAIKCNNSNDLSMTAPLCWPLSNNISCNYCTRECLPPIEGMPQHQQGYCKEGEICCRHECGTYCQSNVTNVPVKMSK